MERPGGKGRVRKGYGTGEGMEIEGEERKREIGKRPKEETSNM